jgi:hypothetical protein
MDLLTSSFTRTYDTFSGADIILVIHDMVIGNANGISFSITREKAPLYALGSVDPISISRGKRGIAGSMIMYNTDRSAMYDYMARAWYASHRSDLPASGGRARPFRPTGTSSLPQALATATTATQFASTTNDTNLELRNPNYSDQIPPFDITLTAMNEYGQATSMAIFGVEILNEGEGHSVDDITSETQMTWICRALTLWHPASGNDRGMDTTFEATPLEGEAAEQVGLFDFVNT